MIKTLALFWKYRNALSCWLRNPKTEESARSRTSGVEVFVDRREYKRFRPLHAELRVSILVQAVISTFRSSGRETIRRLAQTSPTKISRPEGRYIVVCPGAGKSTRKWSLEKLVSLCVQLVKTTSGSIVIVGGESDRDDAQAIPSALPPSSLENLT